MERISLPTSVKMIENHGARAVFAIEPLYPGYGMTVGNALRRVLLSSLPGAAITHVKIEGVTHEFSTLPYVKEDVVDILLNIKKIRLKLHGEGPVTLVLNATGAKTVTAGDIQANAEVEVINGDQPIATLTDKAGKLEMEFIVEAGRGYVPVEQREKEKRDIGLIAIDSIFTPMKNVNFTTENVRVGQMTNYDKLVLDITTDGSITPSEALKMSAAIMVEHFTFVAESAIDGADMAVVEEVAAEADDAEEKPKKAKKKKSDEESEE
jgi:DNA-directed RNA polymerase subunit alpha